ncbi:hypothetical protein L3556_05605 [Candidatus Synechococcus calcipolaris G9]|uniref:Oligosaccharide repeat unit polymerase n=1 Tax=Candidatus Synechococcus calcipolaris G9 TaxID=1497997 RepID=A0ABT6EZ11_9SYNE|nr:hypothetical protein [Candidatus Synechococcus calcipolaris]MDG2990410.1 hypothetical protein [Candidatus Synechococcus calcipolaris G9]
MFNIFLILLFLVCILLLAWGTYRRERSYEFPFFMGGIFLAFLLPQAFLLAVNPLQAPPAAVDRILLFSALCGAMCWVGYQWPIQKKYIRFLSIPLDEKRLFQVGFIYVALGYLFTYLLIRSDIQVAAIGAGWTGEATIYHFLSGIGLVGLPIILYFTCKRPSVVMITFSVIAALPTLADILLAGRRQETFTLAIILGVSLFYWRRILPPRFLPSLLFLAMMVLIPLFAFARQGVFIALVTGDTAALNLQNFQAYLSGGTLELRNAAIFADAAMAELQFGYGTTFWDQIVSQFVPGQIIGYQIKESLQFKLLSFDLLSRYNYVLPLGTTITGIGDTFLEFSYFGCAIFAFMAYFYKHLWYASLRPDGLVSQILYAGLIGPAVIGLTHGVGRFFQELLFQLIFVGFAVYYAQVRKPVLQSSHQRLLR